MKLMRAIVRGLTLRGKGQYLCLFCGLQHQLAEWTLINGTKHASSSLYFDTQVLNLRQLLVSTFALSFFLAQGQAPERSSFATQKAPPSSSIRWRTGLLHSRSSL
jgi:hypothetical protein